MSGRGLNLKYYTGKVSSDSDNQKSKSLGLKNWNNLRREFDFLSRVSTWQKMTFELDFYTMGTNIKCRNQWKIEKLSLYGNLFCIFPFLLMMIVLVFSEIPKKYPSLKTCLEIGIVFYIS